MSSIFLVIFGLIGFSFGWFVYSKFIAGKIYKLDPNYVTPAHQFNDGIDFVPTNKYVLWGAHFTAVAGAAPIIGPAVAVYWGWVPALLWVTFGSIFFAGVHDMGALWASNRHGAKSIGALSESIIGKRASALFMVIIFLLLMLVTLCSAQSSQKIWWNSRLRFSRHGLRFLWPLLLVYLYASSLTCWLFR